MALKQQKDTIERKIELNKARAIELKNHKDKELEEQREKARLKKIQLDQIMQQAKLEE